jgi:pyrimidine-nucleoside phosphorylase
MISGRGLGLTGGTLDKLESVPGFNPHIRMEDAAKLAVAQGFFMAGQTSELAPADQRIYALRDVTSTVDSIPLIVSSILSKKLAASVDGLVMDVKVGSGATFHSIEEAKKLANELLRVGRKKGLKMTALITSMDEPLGYAVGHALEMEECEAFLTAGAKRHPGLKEVVVRLAVEMLAMASNGKHSTDELESEVELEMEAPEAHRRFVQMLESQGGNWGQFTRRNRGAYHVTQILSPQDGQLAGWDARAVAKLVRAVGGTRITKEQRLDLEVGFRAIKGRGEHVRKGEVLAEVTTQKGFDISVVTARALAGVQWAEGGATVEERSWVWEILR